MEPKQPVIFVNGVGTSQERLAAYMQLLKGAFAGRDVQLVHNATSVEEYLKKDLEKQTASIDALFTKLSSLVPEAPAAKNRRVTVLTHSHGTHILYEALKRMSPKMQDNFVVHTFGGITMIPNDMAHNVSIYINEGDLIGIPGNVGYDPQGTLANFLKIHNLMKSKGFGRAQAIIEQVALDKHDKLNPFNNGCTGESIAKFGSTFFGGCRMAKEEVEGEVKKYATPFTDYNIHLITPPQTQAADCHMSVNALCDAVIDRISRIIIQSDAETHLLYSFISQIHEIARQEAAQEL